MLCKSIKCEGALRFINPRTLSEIKKFFDSGGKEDGEGTKVGREGRHGISVFFLPFFLLDCLDFPDQPRCKRML